MTAKEEAGAITLFLCGDVMTGRGIDQILPYPGKSRIFEPVMRSATGYVTLAEEARAFAHGLVETAGVDVVHGHSSHHVKGIEIHRDRLILYGCGDFLNDYEGIGGHESYRGDLSLMYFPKLDPRTGRLLDLSLTPTAIRHFRVNRAPQESARWLETTLAREGWQLGTRVEREPDGRLRITRRNGE